MLAASRRRAGMTHAGFVQYMRDVHGQLARAHPLGVARYVQNHVFDGAFGAAAYGSFFHRDAVAELSFGSVADLQATFGHPVTREVIAPDGANFSDLASAISLLVEERVVQAPPAAPFAGTKVWHWLKLADPGAGSRAALDAAIDVWLAGPAGERLCGHVRHYPLPPRPAAPDQGGNRDAPKAHFGGGAMPRYDAVTVSWLNGPEDLALVDASLATLAGAGPFDSAFCFTLHSTETIIFEAPQGAAGE
jgi:uncharacterized protein (TIGR02118 family)